MSDDFREIEIATRAELTVALAELANDFRERILPLQNESGKAWTEIRFELWIDSGRILAFPACSPLTDRTDVAGSEIDCAEFEDLLDDDDLDDDEYEERIVALQRETATVVRNTFTPLVDSPVEIYDPDGEVVG